MKPSKVCNRLVERSDTCGRVTAPPSSTSERSNKSYVKSVENIGAMLHARMCLRQRTYVKTPAHVCGFAHGISSSFLEMRDVSESGLSLTIGLKEGLIADTAFSQKAQNRELLA